MYATQVDEWPSVACLLKVFIMKIQTHQNDPYDAIHFI